VIYCENGEVSAVDAGKKCIVNVGSVGQPRDGDPRLSFGTFDTSSCVYENIRLPYDSKTARRKIADAGLPARLGDRLLIGH
jgi:diadenosine tetraphosphatase ApaH/serine/threonine PP2A family protein phosphatase